jgi:hypothetical protein
MKLALTTYKVAKFKLPIKNVASIKGGTERGDNLPFIPAAHKLNAAYRLTLSLKARVSRATK